MISMELPCHLYFAMIVPASKLVLTGGGNNKNSFHPKTDCQFSKIFKINILIVIALIKIIF